MILQALYEYYERKSKLPDSKLPPEGFQWKEIPFVFELDSSGRFITIKDTREDYGKNNRCKEFLVPREEIRSSNTQPNLLWDNIEYVFGIPKNSKAKKRAEERHRAFMSRLNKEFSEDTEAMNILNPVIRFLENDPESEILKNNLVSELWKEAIKNSDSTNVIFRILDNPEESICESLMGHIQKNPVSDMGICLITGEKTSIEKKHFKIKGIYGAENPCTLVSFNNDSFLSYGKDQSLNAPVSTKAEFYYTTALNDLLGKDSENKLLIGDMTTVFWAQNNDSFEQIFPKFFGIDSQDYPDADTEAVKELYKSINTGKQGSGSDTKFYVLGLSLNTARLSIRFWHQGTVSEFGYKIKQHFDDLEIIRSLDDTGGYALFYLLREMAPQDDVNKLPPNLAGNIVRSVLEGTPYPATMLQQTLRKIRATREISRIRAGILKAYLNRYNRYYKKQSTNKEAIKVALDPDNTNIGYRLGRLFATLEIIQKDANSRLKTTIKDRYYGAASSTPVTVYPQLLKLTNYHLAKFQKPGKRIWYEQILGEIINGIGNDMPAHLSMEDQARFAIGYYHQRQYIFTKKSDEKKNKE